MVAQRSTNLPLNILECFSTTTDSFFPSDQERIRSIAKVINDILEFGKSGATPCSESFTAGKQILISGHVVFCGRISPEFVGYKLVAYCERDSNREEKPHKILGEISPNGKIRHMACDCRTEMSVQCQHVFAVLLYCNRHNLDRLEFVSEEDILSMHIEDFTQRSLLEYNSFGEKFKSSSAICVNEEQETMIKEKLYRCHFEMAVIKEERE